jgi:hypothetical protein
MAARELSRRRGSRVLLRGTGLEDAVGNAHGTGYMSGVLAEKMCWSDLESLDPSDYTESVLVRFLG